MEMKVLSRILAEVLRVDSREVTEDMTFAEDLDADSLDLYQILTKTEDAFKITVSEDECRSMTKVEDLLRMIRRKTGTKHEQSD